MPGNSSKNANQCNVATDLKARLPTTLQRAAELGSEKGASSWVTTIPIEAHDFVLHKGAFRDALCLRYNWPPSLLPTRCVCGSTFTIDHALSCHTGGFTIICHNEIRDLLANVLSEVCHNVSIEPHLQLITC